MARGTGNERKSAFSAAKETIDFLDGLNRILLYHPADERGDPKLPLGYSEFALFDQPGSGAGLSRPFRVVHGSQGGPGTAAAYVAGEAKLEPRCQRDLVLDLALVAASQAPTAVSFSVPQGIDLDPAKPFDALRNSGIFIADEEAHWLGHRKIQLSQLCRDVNEREGSRTGEVMQLIALCMMMGMGHLLRPEGSMRTVLQALLARPSQPLDERALAQMHLTYHEWRVPLFDLTTLGDDQTANFESFDTVGTLYTFAIAGENAEEDEMLQRSILNHLVAAVQRFTDACAGRNLRHYGSTQDAARHVVEFMAYQGEDYQNLQKWAQRRSPRASAGLGRNSALRAARGIVDAYFKKHPNLPASEGGRELLVELFFAGPYWETEANRLDVLARYPRKKRSFVEKPSKRRAFDDH